MAGEINRKHGDTLVVTLRRIYGRSFAKDEADTATRAEAPHDLDEPSLSNSDHHQDALDGKVACNTLSSGGS
jgi:hypothetical protein